MYYEYMIRRNSLKRSSSLNALRVKEKYDTKAKSFEDISPTSKENGYARTLISKLVLSSDKLNSNNLKSNHNSSEYEINELMSNPIKSKLLYKAIELGFHLDKIRMCFKISENINDEEKFFENLINLSIRVENASNDLQKEVSTDKEDEDHLANYDNKEYCVSGSHHNVTENINDNIIGDHYDDGGVSKIKSKLESKNRKQKKGSTQMNQKLINMENHEDEFERRNLQIQQKSVSNDLSSPTKSDKSNLRPIIIDGNDVAFSQNKQIFQVSRIKSVIDYFEERGHVACVILPTKKEIQENEYLLGLEKKEQLFTPPSKKLVGKRIDCECDLFMLQIAELQQGIIVSNNDFKKILNEGDKFKLIIEERVLMYSFVRDEFIPAPDPLGKTGPNLDNFLLFETIVHQKICPYRKKCTYGTKCKFYHPERVSKKQFRTAHQSVLEEAQENRRQLEMYKQKSKKFDESKTNEIKYETIDILHSNNRNIQNHDSNKRAAFAQSAQTLNEKPKDYLIDEIKTSNSKDSNSNQVSQIKKDGLRDLIKQNDLNNFNETNLFLDLKNREQSFTKKQSKLIESTNLPIVARGLTKNDSIIVTQSAGNNKNQRIQKVTNQINNLKTSKNNVISNVWPSHTNLIANKAGWNNACNLDTIQREMNQNELTDTYTYFPSQISYFTPLASNQSVSSYESQNLNIQKSNNLSALKNELYQKLLTRLPEPTVLWVLSTYPNETDEEKLVFFANDKDFFD